MKNEVAVSEQLASKIIRRLAPLMILMYVFNQLHRANVGYAALTMNAELGMTAAHFGLAVSFFYLGYILFEVPSNLIMHRVGARIWIARILFTWGLLSSLTGLVPSKEWLWGARFVLGIFEAGLFPGLVFYMTLWLPTKNRVRLMAMFVMAIPITGTLAAPISTLIMQHAQVFGLTGWRAMLVLEGIPAVLLGFVVLARLPNRPQDAKWLSKGEVAEITAALQLEQQGATGARDSSVRSALTNPKIWMLGLVYFAVCAGISGTLNFLPLVIKSMESTFHTKYSVIEVGFISAVPFGVSIVAVYLWGKFVSGRKISAKYVATPLAICATALSSALFMPNVYSALLVLAIGVSACFCTMVTFWQLPSRYLTGKAAAAGIGLITSIGVSSGVVMPTLMGYLKDLTGHYAASLIGIAVCMFLASFLVMAMEFRLRNSERLQYTA